MLPGACGEDSTVARVPSPEDSRRVPLCNGPKFALDPLLSGTPAAPASCGWRLWLSSPIAAAACGIRGHIWSYLIVPFLSWRIAFPSEMPCCTVLVGTSAMFTSMPSMGYVSIPTPVEDERKKASSRCGFNSWRHHNSLAGCYDLTAQAGLPVCVHWGKINQLKLNQWQRQFELICLIVH